VNTANLFFLSLSKSSKKKTTPSATKIEVIKGGNVINDFNDDHMNEGGDEESTTMQPSTGDNTALLREMDK
jgi:hypothetical protein